MSGKYLVGTLYVEASRCINQLYWLVRFLQKNLCRQQSNIDDKALQLLCRGIIHRVPANDARICLRHRLRHH